MAGRSLNKVQLIGHLGKDAELRYTSNGQPVATFSLATDESYKPANSTEWVEKTEWHNIVAWGKLAEIVGEYGTKGRFVYVEGKLQTREWKDQNEMKRYTTEVVISEFKLLDKKNDGGGGRAPHPADTYDSPQAAPTSTGPAPAPTYTGKVAEPRPAPATPDAPPDDIPF